MRDHYPLAYHITFGTYGTRLHGDKRGTVDRRLNQPGDPIIGADPDWQRIEISKLRFPIRQFDLAQRQLIESLIPDICIRGGWELLARAARKDHVHALLTAQADGGVIFRRLSCRRIISGTPTSTTIALVGSGSCATVNWPPRYGTNSFAIGVPRPVDSSYPVPAA
jgi:hypothetical protein